jgi:tripartite-type tricarboxylate transporter receptor subunit TctC
MSASFLPPVHRRGALRLIGATAAGALGIAAAPALAQEFPGRGPVRIVVPFPPGGAVDSLARLVATELATKWKQSVVVDNRPGANQIIGTQAVASAAPDGYTLLLATTGHAINATLLEGKLPYNPVKDFAPAAFSATAPNILVAHPSAGASLRELLAQLRASPGKLNAGHPGVGTTQHLTLEILKSATKTDYGIVGYKGTAPALNALLAGEVSFMFDVAAAIPHVKAGKLRALAVTSPARYSLLPDVPTLAEAGLPGVEIFSWYAFLAPAATPAPVLERINRDIDEVLQQPAVRQRLVAYGLEPAKRMQPVEIARFVESEAGRWGKVIRDAGVKAE